MSEQSRSPLVLSCVEECKEAMQHQDSRRWIVGETVRVKGEERLMTVVRCHGDDSVSVAWFEQRKMHLERVKAGDIEPVVSEIVPPRAHRNT